MFMALVTVSEIWFEGLPTSGAQVASLQTSSLCNIFHLSLSTWCFNFLLQNKG